MLTALTILAVVAAALAAPPPANSGAPSVTDIQILQYALTLEHLEVAFYTGGIQRFNGSFDNDQERALYTQFADHEISHVQLLESVLGSQAPKSCNYSFPYTDVQGFKALAQMLEGAGVTAYLGAAQYVKNPTYLTTAGSILTVESRHAAWLATTNSVNPFPGAYDTPLGFNQVYSLAAPFITSCPTSNPKLPVKAFPALTAATTKGLKGGDSVAFNVTGSLPEGGNYYLAFLNGLTPVFVPYKVNQTVTVPSSLNATGAVYAVVTKNNQEATDDTTVAGPAILMFDGGYPSGVVAGSSTGQGSGTDGGNSTTSD